MSTNWQTLTPADQDTVVPIAKICEELAISRATVYQWSKDGKFPALYNDGRTFCWRSHLELYKRSILPITAKAA